jgi:catechol-2,3-dioxygenase
VNVSLNHAVLKVRDLDRAVEFYRDIYHHDLGFLALGPRATEPPQSAVGLFHLAWQVPTIEDLAATREKLSAQGLITGESDHGATKSPTAPLDLDAELRRFASRT